MAIFGDVGKFLGLGTTKQTLQSAAQGAIRGAIVGQPFMGAATGALTSGTQQGQATAVSVAQKPPAETAFSGESIPVSAGGGFTQVNYTPSVQPAVLRTPPMPPQQGRSPMQTGVPAIIGGGTAIARGLGGMLALGGGAIAVAPVIIDQFGNEKKLRVTRRLRSQVKRAVEMFGVEAVADQMGTDVEVIFYILTKKMRNDGPYVTKAAVRKTRQTVRKMKHLCDMYDDLRPAAKRRAPARRASSVTQIKN
tara:strand:+ start:1296 stop:2045 length:750 start_codon:yes stop_codon:yes gene_type:complete